MGEPAFIQKCLDLVKDNNCADSCRITCLCEFGKFYGVQWEAVATFSNEWWFKMITLLSFCGYSFVALAIHYNPSLQVHPMKLIYYTCIVDAMLIMNVF